MQKLGSIPAVLVAAAILLSGCSGRNPMDSGDPSWSASSGAAVSAEEPSRSPEATEAGRVYSDETADTPADSGQRPEGGYIDALAREAIARFYTPGMGEFEMAKAAFDYMLETTTLVDPVGLDLWRIHGDYSQPPGFVENRSLSVLLYHVGMCEDYAATLTTLLKGMGLEAEYVPGLTYSSQGELVDHAWTVVKVDGLWYHLDCQLEQNISRHGSVRYKYFMRGDATMAGSHRWGRNLIDSGLLTAAQNEEIAQSYTPEACPQDYPTPPRQALTLPDPPDTAAIRTEIDAAFREYTRVNGPLVAIELNIVPPVFGLEGYGPQE